MVETLARQSAPPPDKTRLHEAALAHLARFSTTEAGLVRVLDRRVERWARTSGQPDPEVAATCRQAVREIVAGLVALGLIDDAAFAAARAHRLVRAGRSRLQVTAHLAARGVTGDAARAALPEDPGAELGAAVLLARRRRIGPFRRAPADALMQRRELGMLARAGFPRSVAAQALRLTQEAAEAVIARLRQDGAEPLPSQ